MQLQVDNFTPVEWNKQAFEGLVLEQASKDVLLTLVSSHKGVNQNDADFIRGKGAGLVVLLHGAPGIGKTLTAESYVVLVFSIATELSDEKNSIAETTGKPLWSITSGDIGTEPEHAERCLRSTFSLATTWNASRSPYCWVGCS